MVSFVFHGGDNTRFVQSRLKKMKKIVSKYSQWKQISRKQYHVKKSQRKHDALSKRIHIRKKFGREAIEA